MSILADHQIEKLLDEGALGIDPFDAQNLTPNGYDLSVKEVMVRGGESSVDQGAVSVPAATGFLVSTREYVRMPQDVAGQLWMRSSYARRGVLATFGKVEAGFEGELTLAAFNTGPDELEIPIGDRFAQLVFERMEAPPKEPYESRSGNYQGQRGVTLARDRSG